MRRGVRYRGEKALLELKPMFEEAGHPLTGTLVLPFLCNKAPVGLRLSRRRAEVEAADRGDRCLLRGGGAGGGPGIG
ncbi:hypothetical protein LR090_03400 [Candidatus Bipolaricaulota bacterium]|nr:hypothetical protein [Candidatus Bipolaricaulota bacterium]